MYLSLALEKDPAKPNENMPQVLFPAAEPPYPATLADAAVPFVSQA